MPNPLSRVAPYAGFNLGNIPNESFIRRPELAALAMQGIASWSLVEERRLSLFLRLLGGPDDNGAIAYMSVDSESAKNHMISRIAEARLAPHYLDLLRAIQKTANSGKTERDKLAHWIWGYSDELPDALLLANPRILSPMLDQVHKTGTIDGAREYIYVYKHIDFNTIISAAERAAGYMHEFRFILSGHAANRDDELYEKLCAEPPIAERLQRR